MGGSSQLHSYRCVCGDPYNVEAVAAGRLVFCPRCDKPVIAPLRDGDWAEELNIDLSSERLALPLAGPGDWREILPITSDGKNYEFELSDPDDRKTLVKGLKQSRFPAGFSKSLNLKFFAQRKADRAAIGLLHLQLEGGCYSGCLGIMIHHPFHGMGYGTEAVTEIVKFAFGKLNLRRLWSDCDARNAACIGLLKKTGFVQEGLMEDAAFHHERGWIDIPRFSQINRHSSGV